MLYCSKPKTYCEQWPNGCIVCDLEMCDGKKETAEKNVSNKILPCEPCKPTQPECGNCEFSLISRAKIGTHTEIQEAIEGEEEDARSGLDIPPDRRAEGGRTVASDLISRAALGIGKCDPSVFNNLAYGDGWNACIEIIENAPAVDAAPVVHARWIASDRYKGYMCCSHCTDAYVAPAWLDEGKWKYCPACGAKMDGGEGDG